MKLIYALLIVSLAGCAKNSLDIVNDGKPMGVFEPKKDYVVDIPIKNLGWIQLHPMLGIHLLQRHLKYALIYFRSLLILQKPLPNSPFPQNSDFHRLQNFPSPSVSLPQNPPVPMNP